MPQRTLAQLKQDEQAEWKSRRERQRVLKRLAEVDNNKYLIEAYLHRLDKRKDTGTNVMFIDETRLMLHLIQDRL